MGEISATLCNYRDDVENCCTATSGLGIEKHGGLTDCSAALHKPVELLSWEERVWLDGYQRGRKHGWDEGYECAMDEYEARK